jgi:protein TonB
MRISVTASVFASLCLHGGAAALGLLVFAPAALSPAPLPQGAGIQVELVAPRGAASDAMPAGGPAARAAPPPAPEKTQGTEEKTPPAPAEKKKAAKAANGKNRPDAEHAGRAESGGKASSGENAAAGHGEGAPAGSGFAEALPLGARVNPLPEYPEIARQRGQEGKTVLLVEVNIQGEPVEVRIGESSGYPLLDKAATTAVRRWKFIPARKNGTPVPGRAILPVEFRLR